MTTRIACGNCGLPKGYQMAALERIAANLRTVPAPHVALELMDRRCLRAPDDAERDRLMRVSAQASDFEVTKRSIQRVAQSRRRLCRSLKAEHALVTRLVGQSVSFPAGFCGPLCRCSDRRAVDGLS